MNPQTNSAKDFRLGFACAFFAYVTWGIQPAYWKMLSGVDGVEVIAHRYVWMLAFLLGVMLLTRKIPLLRTSLQSLTDQPVKFILFFLAALVGAFNWWFSAVAPMLGQVVELSIGNFLTPLMNIALAVVFFHERLSRLKILSMLIAAISLAIMIWRFGSFPWVAIGVSSTWAIYCALKKKVELDPIASILLESIVLLPLALGYIAWAQAAGNGSFHPADLDSTTLLLIGTGLLGSVPMVAFIRATNNLPLSLLGLCQYISPILLLLLGVFVYHEEFGLDQQIATGLIWLSLSIFLWAERCERMRVAEDFPRFPTITRQFVPSPVFTQKH